MDTWKYPKCTSGHAVVQHGDDDEEDVEPGEDDEEQVEAVAHVLGG